MVKRELRPTWELALWVVAAVAFGAVMIQLGPTIGLATIALLGLAVFIAAYGMENALEDAAYLLLKLAAKRRVHRLERAAQVRARRIQFMEEA